MHVHKRVTLQFCIVTIAFSSILALTPQAQEKSGPFEPVRSTDTLSVDVNLVTVPFSVVDERGRAVQHLAPGVFQVYENGVPQKIAGFRCAGDEEPVNVAMLIDSSYSVSRNLGAEKQAAARFFHLLLQSGENRALAATFNNDTDLLQDYTSNPELLTRRIRDIRANGGTRLIDAIQSLIEQKLATEEGQRVLIVISDGDDNLSRIPLATVIEAAQRHNVAIFTVQVESELARLATTMTIPYLDPARGVAILKDLAEKTGGATFVAKQPEDFARALEHVAAALKLRYTIQYQSNQSIADGTYRRIRIEVANRKYQVHSRDGYYPPNSRPSAVSAR